MLWIRILLLINSQYFDLNAYRIQTKFELPARYHKINGL